MAEDHLAHGQIKFRIVGTRSFNDRVLADVFAQKLARLIRAVGLADQEANGSRRFAYVVLGLDTNSPATAIIGEQRISKSVPDSSGVDVLGKCVAAIDSGDVAFARQYRACVFQIKHLATHAEEKFDHAELTINGFAPVSVDRVFLQRATEVLSEIRSDAAPKFFRGAAVGTFDGRILETDLRGDIPRVIIRLTAGGKDIPCVCPGLNVEDIKTVLEKRVRLTGSAYYDGNSGLPSRIDVRVIPEIVEEGGDFTRWRSSFRPFTQDDWSGDN